MSNYKNTEDDTGRMGGSNHYRRKMIAFACTMREKARNDMLKKKTAYTEKLLRCVLKKETLCH